MKINDVLKKFEEVEYMNRMVYLSQRWDDEKRYEDINEYLKVIQKFLPNSYKIHKKPFSVDCKCEDGNIQIGIKKSKKYLELYIKEIK